ncbi:MAG: GIY-YIG nuclease family protein [Cyclobacteriaceae bacterium]
MYHTYILQSHATHQLYVGQTNDLVDRLKRHNAGHNKSTKHARPWKIIWSTEFATRSEAVKLERKLKSWKNPDKIKDWIIRQSG